MATVSGTTRHWAKTAHFLGLSAWERVSYVSKIYRNAMPKILLGQLLLFGLGVWINTSGHKELNVILMLLSMATWAFLVFHPKPLVVIFLLGGIGGLPDAEIEKIIKSFDLPNFQLKDVLRSGNELVRKYVRILSHMALFWVAVFATLAMFQLENGWAAFGGIAFLAGTGLWSIVYNAPARLYRFATGMILAIGLIGFVVVAYRYAHPQDLTTARIERVLMEKADAGKNARAEELLARAEQGEKLSFNEYEELSALQQEREEHRVVGQAENAWFDTVGGRTVTKVVDVDSFDTQLICGIRPGERDVTIPYQQIRLNEGDYSLSGVVVINGTPLETAKFKGPSNALVRVNDSGCVELSFNLTAQVRAMRIQPQRLNMTFE